MTRRGRPGTCSRPAVLTGLSFGLLGWFSEGFAPVRVGHRRDASTSAMNSPTALGAGVGVSLPGLTFTWVTPNEKRVEKDRSRTLDSYGMMDLLWGVEESDIRAVGVPTELQAKAKEILKATAHLARRGRLTVLKALVRSYYAITHDSGSTGERAEEFLSRIVSVARTLGESEVDDETIVAALLCQAPITLDHIEIEFGSGVRAILEGHKRLLEVEQEMEIRTLLSDYVNLLCGEQGDNLRNLFQSIANDWRAVTLRVAWKHAELDGPFATKREQTNACWAAMNIYSVLAERAGMSLIKNSMEDRAFRQLMPEEFERISAEIDARQQQDEGTLRQARNELLQMLREDPIFQNNVAKYEVKGRVKQPYSIWRKCRARNCTIDELHDLVALRVVCSPIVEDGDTPEMVARRGEDLCQYVLSVVHKLRPHYRSRVKDYIRQPKANGYKSLHTTLQMRLRGRCTPFEVQIRTHEMHQVAEYGLASHFSYKGDKSLTRHQQQETPTFQSRGDFLSWVSQTLATSSVFVWGPDGRLLHLNPGTTLLDVIKSYYSSYAVHKKVSKRVLRQFKLNGQRALICRELRSGDVISM